MKLKYLIFGILIVGLASCKKGDSYDVSKVTVFPTFEHAETVVLQVGDTYTPDGVAKSGEDVLDITVTGTVDVNTAGVYTIVYSAANAEGYDGTSTQMVFVYDPAITVDFSGSYTTSITRTEGDGSNPRVYSGACNITKVQPGIFYVDCLLGGTYSIGYDYGPAYAFNGYISVSADNTIYNWTSYVAGWGDGLEGFQNGVYDDVTGKPYWESIYASGDIYAVTFN